MTKYFLLDEISLQSKKSKKKKKVILLLSNSVNVWNEQSVLRIPPCPPSLCRPFSLSSLSHRRVTFKWGRRWASPPVKCVSEMTWCGSRVVFGGPVLVKRKTSPSAHWPASALLGPGYSSSVTSSAGPVTPRTHGVHVSLYGKPGEWMFNLRHAHIFAGAHKLDERF